MSTSTNPAINPHVPVGDGFDPSQFRSIPWTYGEIGLSNDEFAYLVRGMLHTGADSELRSKIQNARGEASEESRTPAKRENAGKHWWSYEAQSRDMKLCTAKISFINQLLENSGILIISRKKGCSNNYRYRLIAPIEIDLFRMIVEEERAKLEAIYDSDGVFIETKRKRGRPLIRTGEKYQSDKKSTSKKAKKAE